MLNQWWIIFLAQTELWEHTVELLEMAAMMDMTNHKTSIYLNIMKPISEMSGNSRYHRVTILYGKNLANHQMAPKLPF